MGTHHMDFITTNMTDVCFPRRKGLTGFDSYRFFNTVCCVQYEIVKAE